MGFEVVFHHKISISEIVSFIIFELIKSVTRNVKETSLLCTWRNNRFFVEVFVYTDLDVCNTSTKP